MLKYLKYYIPVLTGILFIIFILMGQNYPTYFFIAWSLFLFIGDYVLPRDQEVQNFSYPSILNCSIYVNLPILFCLIFLLFPYLAPLRFGILKGCIPFLRLISFKQLLLHNLRSGSITFKPHY